MRVTAIANDEPTHRAAKKDTRPRSIALINITQGEFSSGSENNVTARTFTLIFYAEARANSRLHMRMRYTRNTRIPIDFSRGLLATPRKDRALLTKGGSSATMAVVRADFGGSADSDSIRSMEIAICSSITLHAHVLFILWPVMRSRHTVFLAAANGRGRKMSTYLVPRRRLKTAIAGDREP